MVWNYLGRASYDSGKLPEARRALERALARNDQEYFASPYLGLALARLATGNKAAEFSNAASRDSMSGSHTPGAILSTAPFGTLPVRFARRST